MCCVLDKLTTLLGFYSRLSGNLRVRDRSVKIIQYGCQMLLAVYGAQLNEGLSHSLILLRQTASTSRKAFWLLRSVEHMYRCLLLISSLRGPGPHLETYLSLWEHVSLAAYFLVENLIFLSRMRLISTSENALGRWADLAWLSSDIAPLVCILMTQLQIMTDHGNMANGDQGAYLDALVAMLDVVVAGRCVGLWSLEEAHAGLCGTMSASIALFRIAQKAS